MEELKKFLIWCDHEYQASSPCNCGNLCSNMNYCQGNAVNCYNCIKRVHNVYNRTIHYNCSKMVLCYFMKHFLRFRAETIILLNEIRDYLIQQQDLYVTSIGCGPCTELFGSVFIWRYLDKQDEYFHYRGFDTAQIWNPIMIKVQSLFEKADIKTLPQDAFVYYHDSEERIDIIILNYMLSDMKKFNSSHFNSFLSNFVGLVRSKKPRYILINDVYLKESISASNELISCLNQTGILNGCKRIQYSNYNPYIGSFSNTIVYKRPLKMPNSPTIQKYDPFIKIRSIQAIIELI